jgi:hypothetical protein
MELATHLLQVRKVVGLWMSKHSHQLPLSTLEGWDRKLWEALESLPQQAVASAMASASLMAAGPPSLQSSQQSQQPLHQPSASITQPLDKDPGISAITRKMEEDRDRQKRAREDSWALPSPELDILDPLGRRAMEDLEFSQIWKHSTLPGLLPEDWAWMRDYR